MAIKTRGVRGQVKPKSDPVKPAEIWTRRLVMLILYGALPLVLSIVSSLIDEKDQNWFASSRNPFNIIFAKNAWGWASLVFFSLAAVQYSRDQFGKSAFFRWGWATLYWILLTQKVYFGTSFRDQVFIVTGGKCALNSIDSISLCKLLGTQSLEGGHRLSGHCLLLIHASLFLWEEFGRLLYSPTKKTFSSSSSLPQSYKIQKYIIYCARAVLILFLWLLMITTVYFHTLLEKLSGIFFGFLFWAITYLYVYPSFQMQVL